MQTDDHDHDDDDDGIKLKKKNRFYTQLCFWNPKQQ